MINARKRFVDAIIAEIVEQEGMARELAEFADLMEGDGHHATAETLWGMSRRRRVKGIELRGNLAALAIADHEATEGGD
ncbi:MULTISPECIES: hypothetical protein [Methylobacterium]|jgi:hypothetical protein|uniref:Uncharacterized protein n=2 Tax=Methylobacterium TaxID=407 RepID=A0A2R4WM15_9HYPH|nr:MULTISPECIES: hypothetical protein [Methylobacterium]MBZ6411104.1 hypothetical protein [Methylobacterium sp.]AWB22556.1 hypothetical protein DA075_17930 [Methylobacterium currus]MBK3397105.1 hypothetical protein [Methylobacterium ajmalii]MBK3408320.1 hypothetical protein [Methylobacterium ajmalii]MBK3421136.1 hypothetical protein [Methylobacterium ajmalii]